jgi:hypothetical protein
LESFAVQLNEWPFPPHNLKTHLSIHLELNLDWMEDAVLRCWDWKEFLIRFKWSLSGSLSLSGWDKWKMFSPLLRQDKKIELCVTCLRSHKLGNDELWQNPGVETSCFLGS